MEKMRERMMTELQQACEAVDDVEKSRSACGAFTCGNMSGGSVTKSACRVFSLPRLLRAGGVLLSAGVVQAGIDPGAGDEGRAAARGAAGRQRAR
eukprot:1677914-Rhodomonas_salina.1